MEVAIQIKGENIGTNDLGPRRARVVETYAYENGMGGGTGKTGRARSKTRVHLYATDNETLSDSTNPRSYRYLDGKCILGRWEFYAGTFDRKKEEIAFQRTKGELARRYQEEAAQATKETLDRLSSILSALGIKHSTATYSKTVSIQPESFDEFEAIISKAMVEKSMKV